MGTRNLTCVVKDGQFRVAQYCQWDGYPSGQGQTITEFIAKRLRTKKGLVKFNEQVDRIQIVDNDYVLKLYDDMGISGDWMTLEEAERFKRQYPEFDRDFGAKILEFVRQSEKPKVNLTVEFAGNSLFCEWAYVIDLDKGTFEVYRGFNKKPLRKSERFHPYFQKAEREGQTQYYPVRLWRSFPLEKVTKKLGNRLQKEYNKEREDE